MLTRLTLASIFLLIPIFALAQTEVDERAVISFDKGLGFFSPDSTLGLNLRFRMQNRIGMTTLSGSDLSPESFEANVRRLRLRFDGFVGKSGLTYYLQLSFSRGDQDWDNSGFPGIVRDAMVFYSFSERFYMGMGQGKLPGNRQRVISSGQQQFADRSLVNVIFNIDRDFGLMGYYNNNIGEFHYNLKGVISTGEGRNILRTDNGLAYTGRLELLPLGPFAKDGDFSEGDLERESSPKISIGATYSFNHKAVKDAGQRGAFLERPVDIHNYFIDLIAKYQGWALQSEAAWRMAPKQELPFPAPPEAGTHGLVYVFTGKGINTQLSYVFPSMFELAGRHTRVVPDKGLSWTEQTADIYTLGFSKYLAKHRNKLQLNLSYQENKGGYPEDKSFWNLMFQLEIGI
jgi:phosphate-selective porin OprO and OprP